MALRPIYIPINKHPFVKEIKIEFKWFAGFSIQQKQKSIDDLHRAFKKIEPSTKPLEVSSKSDNELGVDLSAFNLKINIKNGNTVAVENLFQASKVFENGGPYKDLLYVSPLEAKRDFRLKNSGNLIKFKGKNKNWPTEPKTLYYDWIYINALHSNNHLRNLVLKYSSFTDIEFNPTKSFNCQARSAALYVSLTNLQEIERVIGSPDYYQKLMVPTTELQPIYFQDSLL